MARWILLALEHAGKFCRRRRKPKRLEDLFEDAAAQGFLKFLLEVEKKHLEAEKLRSLQILALRPHSTSFTIIVMGDNYQVGQAGAVGPGAIAKENVFNQNQPQVENQIDVKTLSIELERLREAMQNAPSLPEHNEAIKTVELAEAECKKGNTAKALSFLKGAGKWTFDLATKIGVNTVSAYLKHELGL
jgi:hypothetical protein